MSFSSGFFPLSIMVLRFTHFAACITRSFLFIAKWYSIVWLYHNLSFHLLIEIWVVSSFGLLPIKLLWTSVYNSLCGHIKTYFYLGLKWLDGMADVYFLNKLPNCLAKWLYHFNFQQQCKNFNSSKSLLTFGVFI